MTDAPDQPPDLYAHLGIPRTADDATIRRAYRRKAKSTHPDAPTGSTAKFSITSRALAVLLDPTRRAKYDATGDASDSPLDNSFAELSEIIVKFFDGVCADAAKNNLDPLGLDLADAMRRLCRINIDEQRKQRDKLLADIVRAERFVGRFKQRVRRSNKKAPPKAPPDLIDRLLKGRIDQAKNGLRMIDGRIATFERVAAVLEDYTFEPDADLAAQVEAATRMGQRVVMMKNDWLFGAGTGSTR